MNKQKALKHFEWRFKNGWKPTERDIEAFNAFARSESYDEQINLQQNESLAKLFIHQFILLCRTKLYTSERAIEVINEILDNTVYDWCLILKEEIPMLRFNSIGSKKYPPPEDFNITKIQENNKKIIEEFETELTEALKTEVTEEQVVNFVKKNINRIINTYEK